LVTTAAATGQVCSTAMHLLLMTF